MDYRQDAQFAYNAINAVRSKFYFKKMNLVGHSMGNTDIMFMLLYFERRKNFPTLIKQVSIAAHFNGIRGYSDTSYSRPDKEGKPSEMDNVYQQLLKLRKIYPKTASVMNIYGNKLDGTDSDGPVTIYSSRTLKYIVSSRAKHYEEHMITGEDAQHSKLNNNREVDQLLIKFLWGK